MTQELPPVVPKPKTTVPRGAAALRFYPKYLRIGLVVALGALAVGFFLFPIYWIVTLSLKTRIASFAIPPAWLFVPTLEHYVQVITQRSLVSSMLNSLILAGFSTVISVGLALLAAYGLARYDFKRRNFVGMWILSNKMLPPIVIAVPLFVLFTQMDLIDTYAGMIWVYTAFNIPFAVWLLQPYIEDIPVDLERAAAVDGCSTWEVIWRVVLPLAIPGILATALFCFILTWNEYLFALVLTGPESRTLPVMAAGIRTRRREVWGEVAAAGVLISLPALLFGISIQKHLVRGLMASGVKR
jgi:multiple sugar transport system permease protein